MSSPILVGAIISSSLNTAHILFFSEYRYKIKYGTLLYIKQPDGSLVLMDIKRLISIPVTRVASKYGPDIQQIVSPQEAKSALVGIATILGVYRPDDGSIMPLLSPLRPFEDYVAIATKDIYEKLWRLSGDIVLGHAYVGFCYEPESKNIRRLDMELRVSSEEMITNNILIAGDRKTGKTRLAINLVRKIYGSGRNVSVIIFDVYGEYRESFSEASLQDNIIEMSGQSVLNNINSGFGYEYKDVKDVLSEVGPEIGSRNAIILKHALESLQSRGEIFSIENVRKELKKMLSDKNDKFIDNFIEFLKRFWYKPLSKIMLPNKIVVIDMHRNMSYRDQIKLIASFFREMYLELTNRAAKEENTSRLFVIEDLEKFVPSPKMESTESVEFSREYILNILAASRILNCGILAVTSSPSRVAPLALYFFRTKFVLKFMDPIELSAMADLLGLSRDELSKIGINEVLVHNPRLFYGKHFKIRLG